MEPFIASMAVGEESSYHDAALATLNRGSAGAASQGPAPVGPPAPQPDADDFTPQLTEVEPLGSDVFAVPVQWQGVSFLYEPTSERLYDPEQPNRALLPEEVERLERLSGTPVLLGDGSVLAGQNITRDSYIASLGDDIQLLAEAVEDAEMRGDQAEAAEFSTALDNAIRQSLAAEGATSPVSEVPEAPELDEETAATIADAREKLADPDLTLEQLTVIEVALGGVPGSTSMRGSPAERIAARKERIEEYMRTLEVPPVQRRPNVPDYSRYGDRLREQYESQPRYQRALDAAAAWDAEFGEFYNPDGTPKENHPGLQ